MTGRNRVRYSQEQKEAIVKRMMPPNNESVAQISKEEGITEVTCTSGVRKHVQLVRQLLAVDKQATNGAVKISF